jgi:hypothetical protein
MLAESEGDWEAALDQHVPQYAILYEDNFNYLSKMCLLRMRAAALRMIEVAKARGCTVILCGADATDHAEMYLVRGADFVLLGEGEESSRTAGQAYGPEIEAEYPRWHFVEKTETVSPSIIHRLRSLSTPPDIKDPTPCPSRLGPGRHQKIAKSGWNGTAIFR